MVDIDKEFYDRKEIELFGKKVAGRVIEVSKIGEGGFYKVKILFPSWRQEGMYAAGSIMPKHMECIPETVELEIAVQIDEEEGK